MKLRDIDAEAIFLEPGEIIIREEDIALTEEELREEFIKEFGHNITMLPIEKKISSIIISTLRRKLAGGAR